MAWESRASRAARSSGLRAPRVEVEVHLGGGLPTFSIVGLPATAVKESKDRVRAALANSGFEFPAGRITVNLSPADLPKEGCRYDLPIALGILLASSQISSSRANCSTRCEFYGELGLAGELKPIKGVLLAAAHAAREARRIVVPAANLREARLAAPRRPCAARPTLLRRVRAFARSRRSSRSGSRTRRTSADARRRRAVARPRRRARPGRARSARSSIAAAGGAQPAARRSARHRQEHAGAAAARTAAAARRRRSARRRVHRIGEQRAASTPRDYGAPAVPRAASHRLRRRHHRRRSAGAAGRSEPRASRRVVPRRAARVQPQRARKSCASRSRPASSRSRAPRCRWNIRRASSSIAAMNPCPCGYLGEPPGAAAARRRRSRDTARASPARCSIASTCASRCRRCRAKSC